MPTDQLSNRYAYSVVKGEDGEHYAVFPSYEVLDEYCDRFEHHFRGCMATHFGGYFNAIRLGKLH